MNLSELTEQMYGWATAGNVSLTSLSSIDKNYSTVTKPECCIYDAHLDKATGDLFLVLIKSDGGRGEHIKGIDPNKGLGNSDIKSIGDKKDKQRIWGHPCYYWIISRENIVVSVKFPHSLTDAEMFSCYMKSFVLYKAQSEHLRKEELPSGAWSREFRTKDDRNSLHFRFSMHQLNSVIDDDAIRELLPNITHLIKRETVPIFNDNNKRNGIMAKIPELRGYSKLLKRKDGKNRDKTVNVEYRIELKPTFDIVKKIVLQSAESDVGWECMGFLADGRQVFAHQYRLHEHITKPDLNEDILSAKDLSLRLLQKRSSIMNKVRKSAPERKLKSVK